MAVRMESGLNANQFVPPLFLPTMEVKMPFIVPSHMISATALTEPVEVVRAPEIGTARDSVAPKISTAFPGAVDSSIYVQAQGMVVTS